MAGVKLMVMYPTPTDVEAFDRAYLEEHVPLAPEKLRGKTKFVITEILGGPAGQPPFHRIAEIHYPSIEALQESLATPDAQEVAAHAVSISSGGPPVIMIARDEAESFSPDA
jgi:uncharacterized protein (TIGR02118 family)